MINNKINKDRYLYKKLAIVEPEFGSPLTDLIINLDYLRKKQLGGSTDPGIFFQLKEIFQWLESISSARIEGNHTTIAEFIETKIVDPNKRTKDEKIQEIRNIENAMDFIDHNISKTKIDKRFLGELHKVVVLGLSPKLEGDISPGQYRKRNIKISGATHIPPDYTQVDDYMNELFDFINKDMPNKYDLLKVALVHHRFVWIHPFSNGNGRTVRLLTYAQLVKCRFNIKFGRIINPAAVFCSNRKKYYKLLSAADTGEKKNLLAWSEYVLSGLEQEIKKIDKLLDYKYLSKNILIPAIEFSLERKTITPAEANILKIAVQKQLFQAHDLKNIFPGKSSLYLSRQIGRLKKRRMIYPISNKSRKYLINFRNNFLLRGIINALDAHKFLPMKVNS